VGQILNENSELLNAIWNKLTIGYKPNLLTDQTISQLEFCNIQAPRELRAT
jgi:hypothetical protein